MIDCDFIPAEYHEQQSLRRAVKLRAICVGAMFVIMAIWVVVHHHRLSSAEAMLAEVMLQKDQIKIHADKQEVMKREKTHLNKRHELINQLSEQASLIVVYSDLSRRLPTTVVLTKVTLHCPSLSVFFKEELPDVNSGMSRKQFRSVPVSREETPTITKANLKMTGIAVTQSDAIQFAATLEKSPLFDRVYMEAKDPTVWAGRRVQRFELVCELAAQGMSDL